MLKSRIRKQPIELFQFWIKVNISDKVCLQMKKRKLINIKTICRYKWAKNTNNSREKESKLMNLEETLNHVHYQVNKCNLKDATIFYLKISNNSHF